MKRRHREDPAAIQAFWRNYQPLLPKNPAKTAPKPPETGHNGQTGGGSPDAPPGPPLGRPKPEEDEL